MRRASRSNRGRSEEEDIMKRMMVGVVAACGLLALPAVAKADDCCDHTTTAPCCEQAVPCCKTPNDPAAEAVLIPTVIAEHQHEARPAREQVVVTFRDPVRVGDRILMGTYVIEHDTDRMARGGPCTYIYEIGESLPAVAFHCVHLKRPYSSRATVTVQPAHDATGMRELTEFQFRGEAAGHGVPGVRR
jgi:hypothetical protein